MSSDPHPAATEMDGKADSKASGEREGTASVVIIGAEVLSGKVDDANGPFLIRELRAHGIALREIRTIDDSVATIAATLSDLASRDQLIITTGGVGPTHDDVTMAGVAQALGVPLIRDIGMETLLQERYGDTLRPDVLKLAEVPQGVQVDIREGLVPVVRAQLGRALVLVLPGVPGLMRACFGHVQNELPGGRPFFSDALYLRVGESQIASQLAAVQAAHRDVAIGSYPRFDHANYRVKVTVDGRQAGLVEAAMQAIRESLNPDWMVLADDHPSP